MSNRDYIQKSDNTKVNIGTAELPRYKAPFVPDYWKGQQEYAKGNYTDKNAQAYAEKISGRVESVSPEFELLSALGLKGVTKLFTKPINTASNKIYYLTPNGEFENITRTFTGNLYHLKRLHNGAFKKLGYSEEPEELIKGLYQAYNLEDPKDIVALSKKLGLKDKDMKSFLESGYAQPSMADTKMNVGTFNHYRGSNIESQEFFNIALPHEVHHGLSFNNVKGITRRERPPINIDNLKQLHSSGDYEMLKNYFDNSEQFWDEIAARGTQIFDYFKFTHPDQKLTGDMLKKAAKHYTKNTGVDNNMTEFFQLIGNNWDEMAEWLNKYATVITTPVVGGYVYQNKKNK